MLAIIKSFKEYFLERYTKSVQKKHNISSIELRVLAILKDPLHGILMYHVVARIPKERIIPNIMPKGLFKNPVTLSDIFIGSIIE